MVNYFEFEGESMHYIDAGQGPAVLLLHGNPTWSYFYRKLIEELKDNFRVIAPDHLGCGFSSKSQKRYRAIDRADHLEALLRHLKIERISLVCHDWGGIIGTMLALRDLNRIDKIAYLNTTLTEVESLPFFIKMSAMPVIGRAVTQTFNGFLSGATTFGAAKKLTKEVRRGYHSPYRSAAERSAICNFVKDIPFRKDHPTYRDLAAAAQNIPSLQKVPVQIIWGAKDPCFHRGMLQKLKGQLPHAALLEIPHASHLVLEDDPILANATLRHFLLTGEGKTAPWASAETLQPNALYQAFLASAEQYADQNAVIEPAFSWGKVSYNRCTYRELSALINRYRRGLAHLGLARGDKVLMLVPAGVDFLALSYAVIGSGAIPVYIDPGIGKKKLLTCIENLQPDVFIGSPKAQILRLKRTLFKRLKFHITAGGWFGDLPYLKSFSPEPLPFAPASTTTLIAFTSGATGVPKGVVYNDEMLKQHMTIYQKIMGYEATKCDLPLLPIFSLFMVCLGVCSVIPPLDPAKPLSLDPKRVLRVIKDCRIAYSFGSPTLWQKIAGFAKAENQTLEPLQRIFIAGAPVPKSTLALVKSVLPNGEAYTPYGATEALPATFISAAEILQNWDEAAMTGEMGTYVGKALPGSEIKIIQPFKGEISHLNQAEILLPYMIGEVVIKGKHISPCYVEENRTGKMEEGWHRMGDMGYLDGAGGLYFCGRKAHVVKVKDKIYHSVPLERLFNTHSNVKRSALVSINHGEDVGIVIEPREWPKNKEAFISELKKHVEGTLAADIKKIYFHPSFPVDARHNAKIFRDQLSIFATNEEKR